MPKFAQCCVFISGLAASAGAIVHLAIIFGGPEWYAFFGAPQGLVDMARSGNLRAPLSCVAIAAFLAVLAAYAFSGARLIPRLPFLRFALATIATVLVLRGIAFIPLILWRPGALARICDCQRIDTFIVLTSALCLAMGIGYAIGAIATPARSDKRGEW